MQRGESAPHGPANDLWDCFRDGHTIDLGEGQTLVLHPADAGALDLPSGQIVVSDPLLDPWNAPFKTAVAAGTYPIHLALDDEDEVALVMVLFGEGPPRRWKRARPESFCVDSGTGCLMDFRVARFLRQKAEAGKFERYALRFEHVLFETERWAHVDVGPTAACSCWVHPLSGGGPHRPRVGGTSDWMLKQIPPCDAPHRPRVGGSNDWKL